MAEHMVKRFGVTSSTSLSSDGTTGGSSKAGLHDVLAKFFGQGRRRDDGMGDAIHVSNSQC